MNETFDDYISRFKERLNEIFHTEYDINKLSLNRGFPDKVWEGIMSMKPLSVAIPKEFGGRGVNVRECLGILSAASYESLALSLAFGINIALFLEPLAKYGHEDIQEPIFDKFVNQQAMGGLMITEPDYGSDALNMQTYYEPTASGFHIKGQKHWQGLTGKADFWIVAARKKMNENDLARDVEFFVTDNSKPEQKIEVDHYFNNLGLYLIPYGLNILDIDVPENHKLQQHSTGVKLMLDVLHRSRLQFPGMGMGFVHRLMDDALHFTENRIVGGQSINQLDSVAFQLSRMQSAYTLASGMCAHSSSMSGIEFDLALESIQANSMKAYLTDLMQESAQIGTQLHGSRGFKMENVAGRGIVDSRAFQIFEGPNEMLYSQIAQGLTKQMKRSKESNFANYLNGFDLTNRVADNFAAHLNFDVDTNLKQRQQVDLGKIIARLVNLQYVDEMAEKGFSKELYENTRKHIEMDVKALATNLIDYNSAEPVVDYRDGSDWANYI